MSISRRKPILYLFINIDLRFDKKTPEKVDQGNRRRKKVQENGFRSKQTLCNHSAEPKQQSQEGKNLRLSLIS